MLNFVLPTEKRLVVHFGFFKNISATTTKCVIIVLFVLFENGMGKDDF